MLDDLAVLARPQAVGHHDLGQLRRRHGDPLAPAVDQPRHSPAEVIALRHERRILGHWSTLYLVQGRAKPVLHGTNSTESNLFHHGETAYRVG